MADYGRITIQNGKNYFYDDKTKKLGKEVLLKVGDTALDRNGNRNMWNGTTWISTRGGAVASKLTKKQNGSFTYYGRNDGTGYWKDSAGRRLAEDNILKTGNGNYKRLNPNGSLTILMENGQFTEDGNKLSELFKDNMRKGNVYDVRVSDVNGQKYSKARDIRTDLGEYNLARNIRVGWRNDTDFNTKLKSVNTIGNREKAERERLNREALNIKPQLNWLQLAKSNSSKRIEEVAKAKEFENFISNELSKDARVGTGELLSEPTKIDYTTPFKDLYSPESFFEQPTVVGDKNMKLNKAILKYAETKGVDDLQKVLKGQETINTSKTLDRSATLLAQTGVGLMAAPVVAAAAAPYSSYIPVLLRDAIIYNKVIDPSANYVADKLNLTGTKRNIFVNGIGFASSGITSKLIDRGLVNGMLKIGNVLDEEAALGTLTQKALNVLPGNKNLGQTWFNEKNRKALTKTVDKLRTYQSSDFLKTHNPMVSLNKKEMFYDGLVTGIQNGLPGAIYGALEDTHPVAGTLASIVAPGSGKMIQKGNMYTRRFLAENSGGQKRLDAILERIKLAKTRYTGFQLTTARTNRRANGQKAAFSNIDDKNGMTTVQYEVNGDMPVLHKWTTLRKGDTYKSPYWEEVNPERFMAHKLNAPYFNGQLGNGWANRRSWGDTMTFFSPLSFEEFSKIAKTSKLGGKNGMTLWDYLKNDNLKYDVSHEGDLIIASTRNADPKLQLDIKQLSELGKILSSRGETSNISKLREIVEGKVVGAEKGKLKKSKEKIKLPGHKKFDEYSTKELLKKYLTLYDNINKNSYIPEHTRQQLTYNLNGNRQSSDIFYTPDKTKIHLGSDFGGTGSGGAGDASNSGFRAWAVLRAKSYLDLPAYSLPLVAGIIKTNLTGRDRMSNFRKVGKKIRRKKQGDLTTNNVEAYHINGLPTINVTTGEKKLIHF